MHRGVAADIGLHALEFLGVDDFQGGNPIGIAQSLQLFQIRCFRGGQRDDQFSDALERHVQGGAQFFEHAGAEHVQPRLHRSFRDIESGVHDAAVLAAGPARNVAFLFQENHAELIAAELARNGAPDDTASHHCNVIFFLHAASLPPGNASAASRNRLRLPLARWGNFIT